LPAAGLAYFCRHAATVADTHVVSLTTACAVSAPWARVCAGLQQLLAPLIEAGRPAVPDEDIDDSGALSDEENPGLLR
jgi:hypothetical protein